MNLRHPKGTPFPPELPHNAEIHFTVALFHSTPPPGDVVAAATKLLTGEQQGR